MNVLAVQYVLAGSLVDALLGDLWSNFCIFDDCTFCSISQDQKSICEFRLCCNARSASIVAHATLGLRYQTADHLGFDVSSSL